MHDNDFFARFPHLRGLLGDPLPLCELGPGEPRADLATRLQQLDDATLFAGAPLRDDCLAQCCRCAIWMLFDFLDESHRISQEIQTLEGSYWHGIMHRREPDFMNAKYWFRRVPRHPVYEQVGAAARELFAARQETDPYAEFLEHRQPWNPAAFVDLCESIAQGKSRSEDLARRVAMAEWRLLFEHCYEGATGVTTR